MSISAAVTLAVMGWTAAQATSSVGTAGVTKVDDQPCFSVPSGRSANGSEMRLHSLAVTQTAERADWRTLPQQMWGFTVDRPGLVVDGVAGACIQYGNLPGTAHARSEPRPLQPMQVYRVEINARPADGAGSTLGYEAQFCVMPMAGGTVEVRTVPWDVRARRWRDDVCKGRD